jgi:WD40 repeat protein
VSQPRLTNRADLEDHKKQDEVLVKSATFLAGGKKLAALVGRGGLQMIDTASGKELFHTEGGDLIVASPDERILAVSHGVSGVRLGRHRRYGPDISSAGFSLTSAVSGTIRLLEAETGREIQRMTVDGSEVWAMAFAPDGKTLAATSGWETGQIHFFDVPSGKENGTISSPPLHSPALAFTPDGTRLISGMADGSVLFWDLRARP